jgi:hypothetical protein
MESGITVVKSLANFTFFFVAFAVYINNFSLYSIFAI